MSDVYCPRCDTRWKQIANRTGHCANDGCHRTFGSEEAFDAHYVLGGTLDARVMVCRDPATLITKDGRARFKTFVDGAGATVWRNARAQPPGMWAKAR